MLLLAMSGTVAHADERGAPARAAYVGVFGGWGDASVSSVNQVGTALFPDVVGGPLSVNAAGGRVNSPAGLVGGQLGYEWSYNSVLMPAVEFEGFYLANTPHARLDNPTLRVPEHTFDVNFPMHNAVFLANLVLSFRTSLPNVTPYIGGGLGAARIGISGAESTQVSPPEPGINHFNSRTDSSALALAAQAKAGVRLALGDRAYLFGEYRYLFIDSASPTFGATDYPTHAPTTDWTVRFGTMSHHLAVAGIGFRF